MKPSLNYQLFVCVCVVFTVFYSFLIYSGYLIEDTVVIPSPQDTKYFNGYSNAIIFSRDVRYSREDEFRVGSFSYILLVRVSDNFDDFLAVFNSLKQLINLEKVLIVFIHDQVDDMTNQEIDNFIHENKMQLFYELSTHFNPFKFPGFHPGDCIWDASENSLGSIECENHAWRDVNGHYRQPWLAQERHIWWWALNTVFDSLPDTMRFNGPVIYLEKDQLVAKNTLAVLDKVTALTENICEHCLITLGNSKKQIDRRKENLRSINISPFYARSGHTGLVITKAIWNKIKSCGIQFCEYDDHSWRNSLEYILNFCISPVIWEISVGFSSMFPVEKCPPNSPSPCSPEKIKTYHEKLGVVLKIDFLQHMFIGTITKNSTKRITEPQGGWGDPRDKKLCKDMMEP